jgi:ABC-type dipeptide/oligopeptide/nickel transport system permease component
MATYIIRRLLLMVPTLIGISFMIFMLVALSPGGVGAALRVAGGGATEATNRAVQEAYLEDRYGLDDPVIVQYFRWLGRISPVKFGERDQVLGDGNLISPPKVVKEPPLWRLFTDSLNATSWNGIGLPNSNATAEELQLAYRRGQDDYSQKRATYVARRTQAMEAVGEYLRATDQANLVSNKGLPVESELDGWTPDTNNAAWNPAAEAGKTMLAAYYDAVDSRERLAALFRQKPYEQAGVAIIPGVVSIAEPDLGQSFARQRPVKALISDALPLTLMLNMIAFPIVYTIAVPMGMLAATRKGTLFDTGSGTVFVALWSIPTVWAGVMAIGFLANKEYLGMFPAGGLHDNDATRMTYLPTLIDGVWQRGYLIDLLWHIALPIACMVYGGFAILSKQTRAAMLDNFSADYVRTAKAKGVDSSTIVFAHVFRNSLLPLITMFATIFPAMFGGSVIIERIFNIPGMGSLIIEAIVLKDRELIMANAIIIATVNVLALLLADLLYAAADPRVSYS